MGFEDRQYNQYDPSNESNQWSPNRGNAGFSKYSIITWIIIINVIVWLCDLFSPLIDAENAPGVHWLNYNVLGLNPSRPWAIWSYLTNGFAHSALDSKSSFMHIGMNMLVLFFLGRPVAYKLGRNEFIKFYLLSIIASSIGYVIIASILSWENTYVVGASGAVTAVVILFVFMYPNEKILFMGVLPMYAWVLGILVIGMDLLRAFDPESNISWQMHLLGAAFAAAYFKLRWDFSKIPLPSMPSKSSWNSAKLKIHDPDAKFERLKEDADRILAKISEQGEESLTRGERKTLNQYSKMIRNQNG